VAFETPPQRYPSTDDATTLGPAPATNATIEAKMASNSSRDLRGVVNFANKNPLERIGTTQVGHLEVITMAPLPGEAAQNGEAPTNPHPGRVILSRPFVSDEYIKRQLSLDSSDPAKEITYRFEGINLIESICNAMQLYVLLEVGMVWP
jgi:hypothetical protein